MSSSQITLNIKHAEIKMNFVIVLIIIVVYSAGKEQSFKGVTLEIDYTELAGEAEQNKHDILKFLNQTHVRSQYKDLFNSLLKNLTGDAELNRRNAREQSQGSSRVSASTLNEDVAAARSTRRIVAGRNTSIAAVPWQVSLRQNNFPICGGSILTDIWLITAAHCLLRAGASELSVRLGSSWKTHGGEMYDVKESLVHPRYVSKTKANDAGLVRLYSPLRFSARVLPIRLVERDSKLMANQQAIVSGWGKLKEGGPSATFLQSSTMETIVMKLCRKSGLEWKAIDPVSMFCAGSFNQDSPDACQGDSGGPILSNGVLIGVVSWGLGCARGNFPGVYTRLSNPVIWDWIHQHISNKFDDYNTNV